MRTWIGLLLLPMCLPAVARGDLAIGECGAVVPAGETAALTSDLDCAGAPVGVTLEHGTTLFLNGFSIRATGARAIECGGGACRVIGGATSEIADCAGDGIVLTSSRLVRRGLVLSDIRIHGCGGSAVLAPLGGVVATRLDVSGNGEDGIDAWSLRAAELVASGNRHGVRIRRKLFATGLTADGNAGNGVSAPEGRVRIVGAAVRGNVHAGIAAYRLHLEDGAIIDNNEGAFGIDLYIVRRPRVRATTCGISRQLVIVDGQILVGPPWGICTDD